MRFGMRLAQVILILVVAVGGLGRPGVAWVQEGQPRLELTYQVLSPGGALEVRGVNLTPDGLLALTLLGADGLEQPLGVVTGDAHGDFQAIFELSTDLREGDYTVQVKDDGQVIATTTLAVSGAPIAAEGEGEPRGQDEPLVGPLPQARHAVPLEAEAQAISGLPWSLFLDLAGLALLVSVLGILLHRRAISSS